MLLEGARLGVPRATMLRMAVNVALDALIGAIPLLGDLFDFGFKANLRNATLIERALAAPAERRRADYFFVALLAGGLLVLIAGVIAGTVWLARALIP